MKKSPVYPKYEGGDYSNDYEFDPQLDFSQFLEEARQHARAMNSQNKESELEAGKGRSAQEKSSKKSWKKYLFKWWKFDAKKSGGSSGTETENRARISRPMRKRHVSGPVYGAGGREEMKHQRNTSGLVTNLFDSEKNERQYMCLDHTNKPNGVKAYGPVYLVT